MNVLIISKDPTLFEKSVNTFGDTRKRHIAYYNVLQKYKPGSSIKIITYTSASSGYSEDIIEETLMIYGTRSLHRATYLIDIMKVLPKVLRNWKPHLITVQTPYEEGVIGLLLARILKAKYFPQIHFDLFSEHWRNEHWLNGWRRFVSINVIKRSHAVRVVSNKLKDDIVKQISVNEDFIYTIPVGVNFLPINNKNNDNFRERINKKLINKKVILFVGRFYSPKNLFLWIEVAERINANLDNVSFVMAGDGILLDKIKSLVEKKGLSDKFFFLGSVGHENLPQIYAAADVFLLTSYYESFGRVIVESYLSGVPVVCTYSAGSNDLIINGCTGYIHELDDIAGLTDSVLKLLIDDKLNKALGNAGKKLISESFSTDNLVDRLVRAWLDIYSK